MHKDLILSSSLENMHLTPNTVERQLSKHQIDCSIRVFYQLVYALLE